MIQTIKIHGHEFMSINNWIFYCGAWVKRNVFFEYELDMGWWVDEYRDYVSDKNNNNSVDQQHG